MENDGCQRGLTDTAYRSIDGSEYDERDDESPLRRLAAWAVIVSVMMGYLAIIMLTTGCAENARIAHMHDQTFCKSMSARYIDKSDLRCQ